MKVIIQLTADEYADYIKNGDVNTLEEADMFIKDCLADHAGVFIYAADIRVIPIVSTDKDIRIGDVPSAKG